MRMHGRPAFLVVLLGLWLVLSASARAAPSFAPPPGWDEGPAAAEQARARANAWAKAWGGEVAEVMSAQSDDEFVETLAIVDVAEPIPAQALAELDAGRSWLENRTSEALGPTARLDPDALELLARPEPGVAVLVGRALQEDRTALIAIAPRGARHVAVVLLVPTPQEILYANVFDDAVEGLGGLQAPIAPFRHGPLRWGALGAWLVLGMAFGVEWTRRALPRPGARVAGRQAALVLVGMAVLVLVISRFALANAGVELGLSGRTPWGLAFEIAMGGVVVAGLVLGLTELWERRLEPVASAPPGGSFARSIRGRRSAPDPVEPPAITGDTHVGPPPAVTGDTHVGPPPAVTGNTKVGPAPEPIPIDELDAGPPIHEVISGDIEVDTEVRRVPEPDTVRTTAPAPPPEPDTVKTTAPAPPPDPDTVKTTAPAPPPGLERARPKLEIDWS